MPNRLVVNENLEGEPQAVARVGGSRRRGGKSSTTDNISVRFGLGTFGRQAYGSSSAILRGGWARGSLNISGIIKLNESQDLKKKHNGHHGVHLRKETDFGKHTEAKRNNKGSKKIVMAA